MWTEAEVLAVDSVREHAGASATPMATNAATAERPDRVRGPVLA
jgi:hypothetical protein